MKEVSALERRQALRPPAGARDQAFGLQQLRSSTALGSGLGGSPVPPQNGPATGGAAHWHTVARFGEILQDVRVGRGRWESCAEQETHPSLLPSE